MCDLISAVACYCIYNLDQIRHKKKNHHPPGMGIGGGEGKGDINFQSNCGKIVEFDVSRI